MNPKTSPPTALEPGLEAPGHGTRAAARTSAYEPPRILKRRAVARATLFSGTGPDAGGVVG